MMTELTALSTFTGLHTRNDQTVPLEVTRQGWENS